MDSNISANDLDVIEVDLSTPEIDVELSRGTTPVLETEPISGGGIDTYDANADENKIRKGYSAYVKGRKIEGAIKNCNYYDVNVKSYTSTSSSGTRETIGAEVSIDKAGFYTDSGNLSRKVSIATLTVKPNKVTITPTTTEKTALSSGRYNVKRGIYVAGDKNLIPSYIRKGISIFNVTGTYDPVADLPRSPDLPEGCTHVPCIRFTGKQIVDTGRVCTQNTKIRVVFTRENSDAQYMYGVINSGNTASVTAYLSSSGSWRFGTKSVSRSINMDAELIHVAIVDDTGIQYATGKNTWSGVVAFETIGTLLIGTARQASGNAGTAQYKGKILSFEMWESDAPVLKLVPIINADGVYCFYDAINGNFHASITDVPLEGGNI